MALIDLVSLTEMLANCLYMVLGGGWDQPDYVFCLPAAGRKPDLEYVMQIPGQAACFLPTLIELDLEAGPGVAGLVLVTFGQDGDHRICSAMGMRRDGMIRVVSMIEHAGVRVQDELPAVHGDHDTVVLLLARLMHAPLPPQQTICARGA